MSVGRERERVCALDCLVPFFFQDTHPRREADTKPVTFAPRPLPLLGRSGLRLVLERRWLLRLTVERPLFTDFTHSNSLISPLWLA